MDLKRKDLPFGLRSGEFKEFLLVCDSLNPKFERKSFPKFFDFSFV